MIGNSKTFLELVKEVRKQLGITQEELVHKLGVSLIDRMLCEAAWPVQNKHRIIDEINEVLAA